MNDTGTLHSQPEWCRVTLGSIGDAVITTDTDGWGTFLESVAGSLTGWTLQAATGPTPKTASSRSSTKR